MGLYESFSTNKNYEKSGVWLQYGENTKKQPIKFLIARVGGANTAFSKALEAAQKPYRRQIQTDTMDERVAEGIILDVFARTVILNWEGVQDRDGVDMPYTKENVIKLMTDLPDLFADIRVQAQNVTLFRDATNEVDAKN